MTPWKENLLLILVVAGMAVSLFNTCNQVVSEQHTKDEFARMDSIQKAQEFKTDSILTTFQTYGNFLDSVKSHRTVTIPKKYAPKKAAVDGLPDDSLASEFRATFGQPSH